ncbi:MAG: exodeoxyribonuclease VII small subunit [Verrucomicrobia bacterium]|nr:exodeoxyribonuclease VII small subunit [Verrucomicrobiota bacterium]
MPNAAHKPEELSFEEAMGSLETIVNSLETERLPLEEMVTAYERGVSLLRTCRARIESARQRVEIITADLEGRGTATLEEFTPMDAPETSTADSTKKAKRKSPSPAEDKPSGDIRLF